MTLLFFDGFEAGETSSRSEWASGVNASVTTSNTRTGNYCLQSNASAGHPLTLPSAVAQVVTGFAWRLSAASNIALISIYGDANTTQHLCVVQNAAGNLELRRGAVGGTLLATSVAAWSPAQWRHLQVKATVHDTTGMCQVRVDGVTVIDYTGDTKNAGTNSTIDALRFLLIATGGYSMDDLWVCDGVDATGTQGRPNNDFLGDLKVSGLLPTAAGDLTQMTPSTGANWSCVDDTAISGTTDFVTSSAAAQRDLYQMADLPAGAQTILGVRASSYGQKTDAGLYGVKHLLKENSVVTADATPRPLSTTFVGAAGTTYYRRPSDNALWTIADINALQAGVEAVQM